MSKTNGSKSKLSMATSIVGNGPVFLAAANNGGTVCIGSPAIIRKDDGSLVMGLLVSQQPQTSMIMVVNSSGAASNSFTTPPTTSIANVIPNDPKPRSNLANETGTAILVNANMENPLISTTVISDANNHHVNGCMIQQQSQAQGTTPSLIPVSSISDLPTRVAQDAMPKYQNTAICQQQQQHMSQYQNYPQQKGNGYETVGGIENLDTMRIHDSSSHSMHCLQSMVYCEQENYSQHTFGNDLGGSKSNSAGHSASDIPEDLESLFLDPFCQQMSSFLAGPDGHDMYPNNAEISSAAETLSSSNASVSSAATSMPYQPPPVERSYHTLLAPSNMRVQQPRHPVPQFAQMPVGPSLYQQQQPPEPAQAAIAGEFNHNQTGSGSPDSGIAGSVAGSIAGSPAAALQPSPFHNHAASTSPGSAVCAVSLAQTTAQISPRMPPLNGGNKQYNYYPACDRPSTSASYFQSDHGMPSFATSNLLNPLTVETGGFEAISDPEPSPSVSTSNLRRPQPPSGQRPSGQSKSKRRSAGSNRKRTKKQAGAGDEFDGMPKLKPEISVVHSSSKRSPGMLYC